MSKAYEHELAVEFGGVSIGDLTASIGVGFERDGHTLEHVESMLCGKRLEVFAVCGEAANPSQQQLPGMEGETHPHVEATCDSASLRVTPKQFGSRLRFSLEEIDVQEIAQLAKRGGTLRLNVLGALDGDEGSETPAEWDPESAAGKSLANRASRKSGSQGPQKLDTGAAMPISALSKFGLTAKQCEKIAESKLEVKTVGDLERVMSSNPWWHRDIKGIGKANIDKVSDALMEFRKAHPVPDPDDQPESEEATEYPNRNGEGTDCSTEGLDEQLFDGEVDGVGWEVTVAIAQGTDGKFRSCTFCTVGDRTGGREVPIEESEPYEHKNDAMRAALQDLIDVWSEMDDERKPIAEALLSMMPAPDDVPFGD